MTAVGRFHAGHNGFFLRSLCPLRTYKFRQGYRQQRKTKNPSVRERRNAVYSSSTRNLSCIRSPDYKLRKAIVGETPKLPMSEQGRDHCPTSRHLSCFPTKPHCVVRTAVKQCIKTPTVSTKCSHFSVLSIILPSIIYRNTTALPSAVSPPLIARFREKGGYLSEPLRHFYKIASVKVAVSNATEISLFAFRRGRSSV